MSLTAIADGILCVGAVRFGLGATCAIQVGYRGVKRDIQLLERLSVLKK